MNLDSRIYVAGHRGLVGSALVRGLRQRGYGNIIARTHAELELEHQPAVEAFFADEHPDYVLMAAAKVGGIHANSAYPVDFLLRNLRIEANVIEAAWRHRVHGLLFLGSSCIYPKLAPQPLKEEYVLSGLLEPTNEAYAIAKISGIELCEAYNRQYGTRFLSVMPTNLYGPNDNYDLENSHVLPALIRKFHLAKLAARRDWNGIAADEATYGPIPDDVYKCLTGSRRPEGPLNQAPPHDLRDPGSIPSVALWGTGTPRREFLFSDDLADACIFLINRLDDLFDGGAGTSAICGSAPSPEASFASHHLINIGCGEDFTIRELSELVAGIVGFDGPVEWDSSKPDGTPQKLLDSSRLAGLGWRPKTSLAEGLRMAYQDYLVSIRKLVLL